MRRQKADKTESTVDTNIMEVDLTSEPAQEDDKAESDSSNEPTRT